MEVYEEYCQLYCIPRYDFLSCYQSDYDHMHNVKCDIILYIIMILKNKYKKIYDYKQTIEIVKNYILSILLMKIF